MIVFRDYLAAVPNLDHIHRRLEGKLGPHEHGEVIGNSAIRVWSCGCRLSLDVFWHLIMFRVVVSPCDKHEGIIDPIDRLFVNETALARKQLEEWFLSGEIVGRPLNEVSANVKAGDVVRVVDRTTEGAAKLYVVTGRGGEGKVPARPYYVHDDRHTTVTGWL